LGICGRDRSRSGYEVEYCQFGIDDSELCGSDKIWTYRKPAMDFVFQLTA
jgi:hypothetical protein